jgi:hypothetical protein
MSGPAITSRTPVDLEDFEARLRRSQPNTDPHSDPLAELARLVEGQRLPFVKPQSPRDQQDLRDPSSFAPADREPVHAQQARVANEWDLRGSMHDGHSDARGSLPQDQYGEPVYAQPTPVPPPPGAWRPEDAVWEQDAEPKRRPRVAVYAMGGALCLVLAGVGGTYFLRGGPTTAASAPTIKAVSGPLKVAPEAPAPSSGAASSASVLEKPGEKLGASKVVTSEEQPVDLSQVRTASIPAAGAARPAGAFPEPIKVKTVSVRPDGTIISASEAPAKPAAAAATPAPTAAQRTAANVTGSTPAASPAQPVGGAKPAAQTPPPPAPAKTTTRVAPPTDAPAAKPTQTASATPAQAAVATPTVAKGGFAVQLAAAGSESEARDKIGKYQRQFASSLDGHAPGVVKGEANGKQVWRIRVGGLSREDAVSMCVSIKDSGGSCFVAAN